MQGVFNCFRESIVFKKNIYNSSYINIQTQKCIDTDRYKLLEKYVYIFCKKHLPAIPNSCSKLFRQMHSAILN